MTPIINESFQIASDFVNYTNTSIFLTGKAGTGKTTFLRYCKENKVKNTAVVAPTGVAAINAGGTTIHSFFQLPFSPFIPVSKGFGTNENANDPGSLISRLKLNNERREIMQKLELLIIDEISMVRCDVLDAIDAVLRHVRSQYTRPFGGVQLLLIGDMYQLPPVIKDQEWKILSPHYKSPFFFNSLAIESQQPVHVELNKIYRQNDPSFINILNQVRNNEISKEGFEVLHSRYLPTFYPPKEENYITLTTHNSKAEAINFKALNELNGTSHHFDAVIDGEFYENTFPADMHLKLKVGAQVMFLKNDTEKIRRYFNGKIGVIEKIEPDKISIKCKGEVTLLEVQKEKWKNIRYAVDKTTNQLEEQEIGAFIQFPLRLAWAITIHKSQGLTFEKAIIDAGEAFAPGQVYVALSRCTSLEGIILHSRINNYSLHTDNRITSFAKKQNTSAAQLQILENARCLFQKTEIKNLFDLAELSIAGKAVLTFLTEQLTSFNPESLPFLEQINRRLQLQEGISLKFMPELNRLLDQPELPQKNEALQKRLVAAINHFSDALQIIKEDVSKCPAVTDSKVIATDFNKLLLKLYSCVCLRLHLFLGCKEGFSIDLYLQHKRSYTNPGFSVNAYAGKASFLKTDSPNPDLYRLLREKRDDICQQKNIPVYLVANRNTLEELATCLPQTHKELNQISGFGPAKTRQYGETFLSIIRAYCEENNLQTNIRLKTSKIKRKEKNTEIQTDTKTASLLLYKEGKTITDVARERNLTAGTVEGHLSYFIKSGEIKIDSLVPVDKQETIKILVAKHGSESLKILMENVTPGISYGELRMVLASMQTS